MDLLGQLLTGNGLQASYAPDADFWYQPVGYSATTQAGIRVTAEGANKISAWFRGRDILATTLAMLPLGVYERLPNDEGAEVATQHPLHDALHRKPNDGDDSFTWRRQAMFDLIDDGNAYAWIDVGTKWKLPRIAPNLVTPERIKKGPNKGRTIYHVRDEDTGQSSTHTQDDIFHLRGAEGKGILERARESLGLAIVTEQYAGRIFSKGMLNGGIIEVPGPMDTDSARAMAQSFVTANGEWHMPRVLPMGAKMATTQPLTPEKAQMLLSRKFSIAEIARWLGLPLHMLAELDRSTNNNIEHQGLEFVIYNLGSWLSLWEFGINDQLVLQPARFYAEFTRDALVRGDIKTRWEAYMHAVTTGTYTRNEVRRLENMKKLPGLDTPLDPTHLTGGGGSDNATKPSKPSTSTKAEAIVTESAARLLRKEVAAVQKAAVRNAADVDGFAQEVTNFYAKHADLVAITLAWAPDEAERYCAGQAAQILNGDWVAAVGTWATEAYAAGLAALALEEAAA